MNFRQVLSSEKRFLSPRRGSNLQRSDDRWGIQLCAEQLYDIYSNVKHKEHSRDRQGAIYKIKCADCQATYFGETGRNLNSRLTEHKRATKNGNRTNHIAEHHGQTKHNIDWDSTACITYCTNYKQRLTLESWFTSLEQQPLNQSQQLPVPWKRLIYNLKQPAKQ